MFELAIKLVAQSPENFAYNFIIILCLQISFALAFWLWLKSPKESVVARITVAASAIFLLRIIWGIVLLSYQDQRVILAPVERGLNFVAVAFFVWALAPNWPEVRRLRILGLFLVTVGTAVAMPFAIQNWILMLSGGIVNYGSINQAPVWAGLQIIFLVGCIFSLSMLRPFDWVLRIIAVIPLLISSIMHLFNVTPDLFGVSNLPMEIMGSIIPVWDRFGFLLSIPLFTAVVYRRNFSYLINRTKILAGSPESIIKFIRRLERILATDDFDDKVRHIANLFNELFDTQFVGVSKTTDSQSPYRDVHLFQKNDSGTAFQAPRIWMLNIQDWPAIQEASEKDQPVQLTPGSNASRQLYEMHQEFHLRYVTPIMIVPLNADGNESGLLFLGSPPHQTIWPSEAFNIVDPFARLIAHAFRRDRRGAGVSDSRDEGELTIIDELAYDAKIDELLEQKEKTEARLFQMANRLHDTERLLKVTEEKLQLVKGNGQGSGSELHEELSSLRESIKTIEVSAAGLNHSVPANDHASEWITQAITKYSNELEASQHRINQLEIRLRSIFQGEWSNSFSSLTSEVRTPLTSVHAYTDLLLQDNSGFLTVRQIDLLQRIKNSTVMVIEFLDKFDQSIRFEDQIEQLGNLSDLSQILDLSLEANKDAIQKKMLLFELNVEEGLPPVMVDRGTMVQIVGDMLRNAISLTPKGGTLQLEAYLKEVALPEKLSGSGDLELDVRFIQLSLPNLRISPHDRKRLMDNLNNHGSNLTTLFEKEEEVDFRRMYRLLRGVGGRVWISSVRERDTQTVILLLPTVEMGHKLQKELIEQG